MECEESACENRAAVELDIPWDANRRVCPAHARAWAQKDGVVPTPIEGREDEWP